MNSPFVLLTSVYIHDINAQECGEDAVRISEPQLCDTADSRRATGVSYDDYPT